MKVLRSRVRSAFRLAAVSFIGIVVLGFARPELATTYGYPIYCTVMAVSAALGFLFTAAWITTRKPSPYRNNWAVAASSLSLIWGVVIACAIFRMAPDNPRAEIPALITILVGGAGLYLYAPGGSPSEPESEGKSAAASKRGQAAPVPQLSGRGTFAPPTAVAPSLAGVSASSPEIAAAAVAPRDPNVSWDPLQFIRVPETLQKL